MIASSLKVRRFICSNHRNFTVTSRWWRFGVTMKKCDYQPNHCKPTKLIKMVVTVWTVCIGFYLTWPPTSNFDSRLLGHARSHLGLNQTLRLAAFDTSRVRDTLECLARCWWHGNGSRLSSGGGAELLGNRLFLGQLFLQLLSRLQSCQQLLFLRMKNVKTGSLQILRGTFSTGPNYRVLPDEFDRRRNAECDQKNEELNFGEQ